MTGGRVVVLGRTGRNFAAGMSGGVAYVLDATATSRAAATGRWSTSSRSSTLEEIELVHDLIMKHVAVTGSTVRRAAAGGLGGAHARIVKVMPRDTGACWPSRPARAERARVAEVVDARCDVVAVTVCRVVGAERRRACMGKPTGFIESRGRSTRRGRSRSACTTGTRSTSRIPTDELEQQGARCMDCGIPFCHQGCPLGQPDPRLERPGLPRPLARGDRPPARHQQLPRVHRASSARPRARRRACSASTTTRSRSSRSRRHHRRAWEEGWVAPSRPSNADREEGGDRRLRPGRPGRGRAAEPRRALGDGLREGRPHRRPAPLRHPRLQDGEAPPRPPAGADGGRRGGLPRRRQRRRRPAGRRACAASSTPCCWPAAPGQPRDLPVPGRELTASTSRWTT